MQPWLTSIIKGCVFGRSTDSSGDSKTCFFFLSISLASPHLPKGSPSHPIIRSQLQILSKECVHLYASSVRVGEENGWAWVTSVIEPHGLNKILGWLSLLCLLLIFLGHPGTGWRASSPSLIHLLQRWKGEAAEHGFLTWGTGRVREPEKPQACPRENDTAQFNRTRKPA